MLRGPGKQIQLANQTAVGSATSGLAANQAALGMPLHVMRPHFVTRGS
jgi:hypothetical protein